MLRAKKRYFTFFLTAAISLSLLVAGCSNTKQNTGSTTSAGGNKPKPTIIKVGATPKPHAELLEQVKPVLAKEGIDLQIKVFNDYVQPNLALDAGDIDANFFQHTPYLETFTKERNLKLVSIGKVHIEPMGIYSKKVTKLADLKNGDTIAIPNDPSNAGRALALLQKAGLIKLKDGVGIKGTIQDIAENPKQLKITPLDAPQLPRVLTDPKTAAAVINTNFALEAGLNPTKDALFIEDKDSPYANIVVVKESRANDPNLQELVKALNTPEIKKFIEETYKGSIIPAF